MEGLRRVAIETGFLSRSIRGTVWPMLLNVTERHPPPPSDTDHREKRQVELDVHRSLTHVGLAEGEREERLGELGCLIDSVLAAHPDLHYYQGFNDVCSTLVVVMGDAPTAYPLAERFPFPRTLPPSLSFHPPSISLSPSLLPLLPFLPSSSPNPPPVSPPFSHCRLDLHLR